MSLKIGVIVSTTRPTRVGRHVADWFMGQAQNTEGIEFEILDLKDWDLPFLSEPESASSGNYAMESSKKWSQKIAEMDGFVFVTAEYNNGPPAPLKNAIDTLYHEWDKKPVAFVGYGGYGATRAVEQLVNITAKVGMAPIAKTFVGVVAPWESIGQNGEIDETFVQGNVKNLVASLKEWTELLKPARS